MTGCLMLLKPPWTRGGRSKSVLRDRLGSLHLAKQAAAEDFAQTLGDIGYQKPYHPRNFSKGPALILSVRIRKACFPGLSMSLGLLPAVATIF